LDKIERNEQKVDTLCSRVDHFQNLSSRKKNSIELEVETIKQLRDVEKGKEQLVNTFQYDF
jgi:hypothetical protein